MEKYLCQLITGESVGQMTNNEQTLSAIEIWGIVPLLGSY